jgi:hypothetical protein
MRNGRIRGILIEAVLSRKSTEVAHRDQSSGLTPVAAK